MFISCVYAYNRNYQEIPPNTTSTSVNNGGGSMADEAKTPSEFPPDTRTRYKIFTLDYLIKHLIDYSED